MEFHTKVGVLQHPPPPAQHRGSMKKLVAAVAMTAGAATAMPQLEAITEAEAERFDATIRAIEAETYRGKVKECVSPQSADREFIIQCLDDAENSFVVYPDPEKTE